MTKTSDRALSDVYTVQNIGRTQEVTPEGFLLCRDVPIARIGEMLYGPGEVPVEVGRDHIARVTRDESVLMDPRTLASYEGKPVTVDHPSTDVTPDNWRELAVGLTRNVRPGTGIDTGNVMADLLIMDADAIAQVRDGLREVSCGYDAEYVDDGNGRGRQVAITGNHVALVRRGRCGPVCSIGDAEMKTQDKRTADRKGWLDRMKAAFYTKDEDAFVKELQGAPDVAEIDGDPKPDANHIVINLNGAAQTAPVADDIDGLAADPALAAPAADPMAQILASLQAIEGRLTALEGGGAAVADPVDENLDDVVDENLVDEDGDGVAAEDDVDDQDATRDAARKTKDAATVDAMKDEFADTVSRAEVLSPGIRLPTFDAKSTPKRTIDTMCALRRSALSKLSDDNKVTVAPLLAGLNLKTATCDSVKATFVAASELVKLSTNTLQFVQRTPIANTQDKERSLSIKSINERNAAAWARK